MMTLEMSDQGPEMASSRGRMRPRARLMRTLGSDLVSSEMVALIELVKNSYDADASVVLIRFYGQFRPSPGSADDSGRDTSTTLDVSALEVWDNGHGMDEDTLRNSWLDLATDYKVKNRKSESGRRRVLGEKGIGRLSASRLGDDLLLVTKRSDKPEVSLLIDWTEFDRPNAYLDEVEVGWDVGPARVWTPQRVPRELLLGRDKSDPTAPELGPIHGTHLRIEHVATAWSDALLNELRAALSRLVRITPADLAVVRDDAKPQDPDSFKIFLDVPVNPKVDTGEVGPPEQLEVPHYRLSGTVQENGQALLIYERRSEPPVSLGTVALWKKPSGAPIAGPFTIDLRVWDRDRGAFGALPTAAISHFRAVLDAASGVSLYRDGFRVLPFGEAGDDWLGLDRRRIQNPSLRISNNQVIGSLGISADTNTRLRDQSNREGLIGGQALDDLKGMVQEALALLEVRRFATRREEDKISKEHTGGLFDSFVLSDVRSIVKSSYPQNKALLDALDAKSREIDKGVVQVQNVISQYSRLATLGSLVDRVLHDGRTSVARLKNIARFGSRDMDETGKPDSQKIQAARTHFSATGLQANMLANLFNQIEPFGGRKRGRPKTVSVQDLLRDAQAIFQNEVDEKSIGLEITGEETRISVDASEFLTVIVNLVQNAIYWVGLKSTDDRRIIIAASRLDDGALQVLVSDSGPGVPEELRDSIFDPYFSSRANGVGLGLSIAGNIVHNLYGGDLSLVQDGPLRGATFRCVFRKRVGA